MTGGVLEGCFNQHHIGIDNELQPQYVFGTGKMPGHSEVSQPVAKPRWLQLFALLGAQVPRKLATTAHLTLLRQGREELYDGHCACVCKTYKGKITTA